jgi:hypothetical protein
MHLDEGVEQSAKDPAPAVLRRYPSGLHVSRLRSFWPGDRPGHPDYVLSVTSNKPGGGIEHLLPIPFAHSDSSS